MQRAKFDSGSAQAINGNSNTCPRFTFPSCSLVKYLDKASLHGLTAMSVIQRELNINILCSCTYFFFWTLLSFRITYVQSAPGVTTDTPQQPTAASDATYLPSSITTVGFTAIAPAGQTLVQPIDGQPPLLTPALPLTCDSHTSPGQTAGTVARQVNKTRKYVLCISYCTLNLYVVHNCVVIKKHRKQKCTSQEEQRKRYLNMRQPST